MKITVDFNIMYEDSKIEKRKQGDCLVQRKSYTLMDILGAV